MDKVPHDFYHLPQYISFVSRYEGGEPVAFWAEDKDAALLIPLLIKPLPPQLELAMKGCDALSPYGYPGPILYGRPDETTIDCFLQKFMALGKERGIISVFLRSHPLLQFPIELLEKFGSLVNHGQTVHSDLTASAEVMWQQTCKNHKRNIRKLQKNGFVTARNDWGHWRQFMEVYRATMRRVGAKEFYLFSDDYFEDLKEALEEKLDLWTVLSPDGQFAAGGVFTVVNGIVEYHLGGTAEKFLTAAPSKLMFSDVRNWGKEAGNHFFHLGGGLGGKTDSLFKFKAGFSQNYTDFFTFRMVLDQPKYDRLEKKWRLFSGESKQDLDSFPIYRRPF